MTGLWLLVAVLVGGNGPDTLDLPAYLAQWKAHSPDLRTAARSIEGARGDALSLQGSPGWQVSGTYGYAPGVVPVPATGLSDKLYGATLSDNGALWDLLTLQRSRRSSQGEAGIRSAEASARDAARLARGNAVLAWVQAVAAVRNRRFAEAADSANRQTESLVELRRKDGAASDADVLRARTARLESSQALSAAWQGETATLEILRVLAGLDKPVAVPDSLPLPQASLPEDTSLAGLEKVAHEQRPDLVAAQQALERDQAALASARDQWVPSVQLAGGVQQMGDGPQALTPRTWSVTATVGLPGLDHARGANGRAEADLRTQEIAVERLRTQVDADVISGWAAWVRARERSRRSGEDLLPSALEARELVAIQYAKGAASLLDLLDADRALCAARAESVQARADLWTASVLLEQALGKDLP
jgi:outer membrane protein TolC